MPTIFDAQNPLFGAAARTVPSLNDPLQPLSPEEQQSLLDRIGSGTLHGLGWIGGSLSKAFGGRAIRGLLGGKPEELLSAIPFSDTLGITDAANEVHGSDLLGGDHNTSFFSPEGIGGLALDIGLDPATYLTLGAGALTKLGKVAQKANVLPGTSAARLAGLSAEVSEPAARLARLGGSTIQGPLRPQDFINPAAESLAKATGQSVAEVAGQRLGGHIGFHVPFTDIGTTFDLSGIGSALGNIPGASAAGQMLSDAVTPFYRGANALFRKPARSQLEPVLQDLAMQGTEMAGKKSYEAFEPLADLMKRRQELSGWKPGMEWTPQMAEIAEKQRPLLQRAIELTPADWSKLDPALAAKYQAELASMPQELVQIAQDYRAMAEPYLQRGMDLGYFDRALAGGPQFMHRQATPLPMGSGRSAPLSIAPAEQKARDTMFRGLFTEGQGSVNELARDLAVRNAPVDQAAQDVLARYLPEHGQLLAAKQANPAAFTSEQAARLLELQQQAKELVQWQRGTNEQVIQKLGGYFVNDPLKDFEHYIGQQIGRQVNAEQAYRGLAQMGQAGGEVPLQSMLGQLNLRNADAAKQNLIGALIEANPGMDMSAAEQLMGTLGITAQQAERMKKFVEIPKSPAGAGPWLGLMDSILNLTKAGQTSWPSTLSRNFISDIFTRFAYGGEAFAPLAGAKALREGQTIAGLAERIPRFAGMTDEQATQQLLKETYQLGLSNTRKFQVAEASGIDPATLLAKREMPTVGVPQNPLMDALAGHIPGAEDLNLLSGESKLWPLNVRGVGGRTESKFGVVGASQSVQSYMEEINRLATYLSSAERGYSPLAGMQEVIKAHHDFGNLSNFERDVMRRIVPFYSWMRQNVPQIAGELATNPGGRMAQTLRAVTEAGGQKQGLLPKSLSETGEVIPVGQEDGRAHYLTSIGLPFEDLTQLMSLQGIMGSTSPFVRMPWELATGRQVFNNREIPAAYPLPAGPLANSLIMNSPLSRVFSQGNVALDPNRNLLEKMATLGLGQRITTVDQNQARQSALRDVAEQMLRGLPQTHQFSRVYVPNEQIPTLSPAELEAYRLLLTTQRR